jgi:hypothetical protein
MVSMQGRASCDNTVPFHFASQASVAFDTLGTGDDDQGRDPASRIASAQRSARQAGLENLLQFGN